MSSGSLIEHQKIKGHTQPVWSVAFSPDSSIIASCSCDKSILLSDPRTGQELQKLDGGHAAWVRSVAFSPDSRMLASCGGDGTLVLWDVKAGGGSKLYQLNGHTNRVHKVIFSPSAGGSTLASCSSDGTVRLWDCGTGAEVYKLEAHSSKVVNSIHFSPDGALLLSCGDDGTAILWDLTATLTRRVCSLKTICGGSSAPSSRAFCISATKTTVWSQLQEANIVLSGEKATEVTG